MAPAALATVLLLACAADDDPGSEGPAARPPIAWTGEHLELGTDSSLDTVCAGTLPWADRFVGYVGGVFGNPDAFVSSYWVADDISEYCDVMFAGCSSGTEAFSRAVMVPHELVHASRGPLTPHRALEEGIAELYGGATLGSYPLFGDAETMLRDYAGGEDLLTTDWYGRAGHFASFLRWRYGTEALVRLRATSKIDDDWELTRTAFQQVFGEPIEQVLDRYRTEYTDQCDGSLFRDTAFDCQGDFTQLPVGPGTPPLTLDFDLACANPDVVGTADTRREQQVRVEATRSAWYRFWGDSAGTAATWRVRPRPCDQSCADFGPETYFGRGDWLFQARSDGDDVGPVRVCVPAGTYTVAVSVVAIATESPSVSLAFEYDGEDADCPSP